jgi:hypothetical protein
MNEIISHNFDEENKEWRNGKQKKRGTRKLEKWKGAKWRRKKRSFK